MNGFKYALTFTIGAAVGSVVTWKLLKTRYEQIAQEEIDSVKEVFSRRRNAVNDDVIDETEDTNEDDADKSECEEIAENSGYINYSDIHSSIKKEGRHNVNVNSRPYVIAPEEFGENGDYECLSLTYYADEILADDDDEIIEDVDNTVGLDSLKRFGDYEPDSVFVRDDAKKRDYEILLDRRSYSDVTGESPHLAED